MLLLFVNKLVGVGWVWTRSRHWTMFCVYFFYVTVFYAWLCFLDDRPVVFLLLWVVWLFALVFWSLLALFTSNCWFLWAQQQLSSSFYVRDRRKKRSFSANCCVCSHSSSFSHLVQRHETTNSYAMCLLRAIEWVCCRRKIKKSLMLWYDPKNGNYQQ